MILSEHLTFNQAKVLVESADEAGADGKKKLFMTGTFIQGGVRNLNGRVYPISEIRKAVQTINDQLDNDIPLLGECDHPELLQISIDRVSHVITKMWVDGNCGAGRLQVLPTPTGQIIRTLIESGVKLGVSSRGSGNVSDNGDVSDFEIVTIDIVARPSGPDCYPKPVFEAKNSKRGAIITDLSEALMHDPKAQKFLKQELMEWIKNLK